MEPLNYNTIYGFKIDIFEFIIEKHPDAEHHP